MLFKQLLMYIDILIPVFVCLSYHLLLSVLQYLDKLACFRYNFERFSNNLARVKRLNNWREPIAEGYFPKLDSLVSSRVWPPRAAGTILRV